MGPKKGGNSKALAAKERKTEAKEKDAVQKDKSAEDAAWAAAGEGSKTKAQAKKEEQVKQREEAAARKAEAKRLAAEEESALSAAKPSKAKTNTTKLQLEKEARRREQEQRDLEQKSNTRREVTEDTYEQLIASPNTNKSEADTVEARSVGQALSALNVGKTPEEDRHPERRAKAAFEAYQERELQVLKEEKPGLKQSQYKEMLWKSWQKAPENPFNRVQQ